LQPTRLPRRQCPRGTIECQVPEADLIDLAQDARTSGCRGDRGGRPLGLPRNLW
jgi:hypothetical protein